MGRKYLKDILSTGKKAIGCILQVPTPEYTEFMGYLGLDYVIFDTEHGNIHESDLPHLIRSAEAGDICAMVRVPCVDEVAIKHALDMGATGIIVPNVSTVEEAKDIVKYAKYYPEGRRGVCPYVRANMYGIGDPYEYYKEANRRTFVGVLLESLEGVKNAEAIAQIDGIDCVSVGNVDLSVDMSLWGQPMHPEIMKYVKEVAEIAGRYGKHSDAFLLDIEEDLKAVEGWEGITYYCVVSPDFFIKDGYKDIMNRIQKTK